MDRFEFIERVELWCQDLMEFYYSDDVCPGQIKDPELSKQWGKFCEAMRQVESARQSINELLDTDL